MASNYNGQPRPAEIVVADGVARVARRRETWEELLASETGTGAPVAAVRGPASPLGWEGRRRFPAGGGGRGAAACSGRAGGGGELPWERHRSGGGCSGMADVLLDDVSRVFRDGSVAVSHLSLHVRDGELLVIVGPSGCGKSTVLRLIAGLDPLTAGTISIGGRAVNHLTPGERNVAMGFEAAALYPPLPAAQNLRFGLAMRKLPSDEIQQRVEAETRVLRLGRFLDRKPKTLSAGQRQRVAVGRATVRVPDVFLLDEPLTHMDAGERVRLRTELAQLQHGLGVTAIYVTHDQAQAMAIGDRVAVMRAGRIEQIDEPRTLYQRPTNTFVASFMGEPAMNLLSGFIEEDAGRTYVVIGGPPPPVPA